jgi:hypothetical protein
MNVPPFSPPAAPPLQRLIERAMASAGGWLGFDRFMALALYAPGLGYYSRQDRFIGADPARSDFVTAPTLGPWFGRTLVHPVRQALEHTGCDAVWEFGAGTGDLALQLLDGFAAIDSSLTDLARSVGITVDFAGKVLGNTSLNVDNEGPLNSFGVGARLDEFGLDDGATPIEEFNEYFGVSLSDEEFDTVAGLIMKQLGRLPRRGEILHIGDIEFRVTRADRRRIDTLKVIPPHDVLPLEDRETAD